MTTTLTRMASEAPPEVPDVPIYRLSVRQYHQMADAGILTEDDPVELLDGWLVRKMTKHKPHTIATRRARRALERILPSDWYADSQEPITIGEWDEPEPDVFVARAEVAEDPSRHAGPHEVALVVEVAARSLSTDRERKKRVYARAGIRVYWIVNLSARTIEVYTDPTGPADAPDYRSRREYAEGERIPVMLDDVIVGEVAVSEILPEHGDAPPA